LQSLNNDVWTTILDVLSVTMLGGAQKRKASSPREI